MQNQTLRIFVFSSLAIVLMAFVWGLHQIPNQTHMADQALRESLSQESIVLDSAVKAGNEALKFRLLDVLKTEDHVTRALQDSVFVAAGLLEWDQVEWKTAWYTVKPKSDLQNSDLKSWLKDWPLSKLSGDEVYLSKVADIGGIPYFALLMLLRKTNQTPMVGVGIFPAGQFGLSFSADENREIRVFNSQGYALALTHPAYLGTSLRGESLVHAMLENDDVNLRQDWKTEHGTQMHGVAAKVGDSNLYVAIEGRAPQNSNLASYLYLLFCTTGAIGLNWVLFSSILNPLLNHLIQSEEQNEQLIRQINDSAKVKTSANAATEPLAIAQDAPPPFFAGKLGQHTFIEGEEPEVSDWATTSASGTGTNQDPNTDPETDTETETETQSAPIEVGYDLSKILKMALRTLETPLQQNAIEVLKIGLDDIRVDADPLQLQTAIEEILKNAIEAMNESEPRNLTISAQTGNGRVRLCVQDTGVGISAGDEAKVFDPFFSTKNSEGTARGLGLNVVRRVMEELAGTVKLSSRQGKKVHGTLVEIDWPLKKAAIVVEPGRQAVNEIKSDWDFALADSDEEFAAVSGRAWPEVAVRKPVVRSLD